jgi:hypothetical protein
MFEDQPKLCLSEYNTIEYPLPKKSVGMQPVGSCRKPIY